MLIFDMIAFDPDDTLWYYERLYAETQAKITNLLAPFGTSDEIDTHHKYRCCRHPE